MILVNGYETDRIAVNDRGFQYGDGLFETIQILAEQPVFLSQHLQRLMDGCTKLGIPAPDPKQLKNEIIRVCQSQSACVLKIIVSRGVGGRGYRQPENVVPTRVISLHPYPQYPQSYYETGINTRFCTTLLGLNPVLAGLKHLNRLEQIIARAEWDDHSGIQEGIMSDINNHVIEGTMTNLFYVKNDIVYTAALTGAGVKGIIRSILIKLLLENNRPIVEHHFDKETLLNADEVFVCNSIIGIWPVKKIDSIYFRVGKTTRQLQNWLTQLKEKEVEYYAP